MNDQELPGVAGACVRRMTHIPSELPGATRAGACSVAKPGALLRVIPNVGRFLALNGNIVKVAPDSGVAWSSLMPLVYGPMAAALIHQRGELPLHGATLAEPSANLAYAVVAPQGGGKSTLAFELVRRGWRLVSDDLTRLTIHHDQVVAWPGRNGIKLCGDACDFFSIARRNLTPVGDRGKLLADIGTERRCYPLAGVFALDRRNEQRTTPVTGAASMALLSTNTMKLAYASPLGVARAHMNIVARVASLVPTFRLSGPGDPTEFANRIHSILESRQIIRADAAQSMLPSR